MPPVTSGAPALEGRRAPSLQALIALSLVSGSLSAPLTTQLSVYIESLHWSPLFTASLQTAQMGLAAAASILGGVLADTIGVKRTLMIGFAASFALALVFLSAIPVVMLLLAFAGGAAFGCQSVAGQAYLLAASKQARLGLGTAAFFLGNTLGSSIGNFVAGTALDKLGFPAVMGTIGALSCLLVVAAAVFLPAVPREGHAEPVARVLSGYTRLLKRHDILLLCGVRYLTTCYWGAVTLLLPLLLFRLTGSKAVAGTYGGVSLAVAAICSLSVGRLSDRVGRRWPAVVLISITVLDAFALARFSGSVPGLFAAGAVGAGCAWSMSTLVPGLIGELSATVERGRAVGPLQAVWSAAMLSGSLIGGGLVSLAPVLPFVLVGCGDVAALALMVVLLRRSVVVAPDGPTVGNRAAELSAKD